MTEQLLFDRLAYMDRLTRAGIPEDQARAHADAMHEALGESVATKGDVAALRIYLDTRLAQLETKLTVRMGVGAVALFAALASLKFFG